MDELQTQDIVPERTELIPEKPEYPSLETSQRSGDSVPAQAEANIIFYALGIPKEEHENALKVIKATGSYPRWEAYKRLLLSTKDKELGQEYLMQAGEELANAGFSYERKLTPFESLQELAAKLDKNKTYPEAAAVVETLSQSWKTPTNDEVDQRQKTLVESTPNDVKLDTIVEDSGTTWNYLMDEYRKDLAVSGLDPDSIQEQVVGALLSFGIVNSKYSYDLANAVKLDVTGVQKLGFEFVHSKFREAWAKANRTERQVMLQRYVRFLRSKKNTSLDFTKLASINALLTPNIIENNNAGDYIGTGLAWDFLDIVDTATLGAGFLFRTPSKVLKRLGVQRNIGRVSKEAQSDLLKQMDRVAPNPGELKDRFGVTQEELAATKLPKQEEGGKVDDIPSTVSTPLQTKIKNLLGQIDEQASQSEQILRAVDNTRQIDTQVRELEKIERLLNGKARVELTTIDPIENGFKINVRVGANEKYGFTSDVEALEFAKTIKGIEPDAIRIDKSDGADITPTDLSLDDIPTTATPGNYYVRVEREHQYTLLDQYLFNFPTVSANYLGRANRYALAPSSYLDRDIYSLYTKALAKEQALKGYIQKLIAPVLKLPLSSRNKLINIFEYSADIGKKENRSLSLDEIQEYTGYSLNRKELEAYELMKVYYNTLYKLNNRQLYLDYRTRNFKTLRSIDGGQVYHGARTLREDLPRTSSVSAWDPELKKIVTYNSNELDKLYEEGGYLIRGDDEFDIDKTNFTTYVAVLPVNKKWTLGELSSLPLRYIHGYYPKMYIAPHYILKVTRESTLNGGKILNKTKAVATAESRQEAEIYIKRLREANDDENIDYVLQEDARLSEADRVKLQNDRMKLDSRLFFEDRTGGDLYDTHGRKSDIMDPINMLQVSANLVSRSVSMERLTLAMKNAWYNRYRNLVEGIDINSYSAIDKALAEAVVNKKPFASEAYTNFKYIQVMAGMDNVGISEVRRASIAIAEGVYNLTKGFLPEKARKFLTRNADRLDPANFIKNLAFTIVIAGRFARQIFLQSFQHFSMTGLDPLYIGTGRAFSDAMGLNIGLMRRNTKLTGSFFSTPKDSLKLESSVIRRAMGLSKKEYDTIVEKYDQSGIGQLVNIHSYTNDIINPTSAIPTTRLGELIQSTVGLATLRPLRKAGELGFVAGEKGVNAPVSWLLALRRYKAKTGKTIEQMTDKDWDNINQLGIDYAGGMNKANAAAWQRGNISVITQFMQFTHKQALIWMRAFSESLGNKAFTRAEAQRIVAFQLALYGGAIVGYREEIKNVLLSTELGKNNPEVAEFLSAGLLDWVMDTAYRGIMEDPEINMNWTDSFSPGNGVNNIVQDVSDLLLGQGSVSDLVIGTPGFNAAGRVYKAVKDVSYIYRINTNSNIEWDRGTALTYLDAALQGYFAGYSDKVQRTATEKLGYWINSSGEMTSLQIKHSELLAKQFLGVDPKILSDHYAIAKEVQRIQGRTTGRYTEDEVNKDVAARYNNMVRIVNLYGKGMLSQDKFKAHIALENAILDGLSPSEKLQFAMKWEAMLSKPDQRDPVLVPLLKLYETGVTPKDYMEGFIKGTKLIKEDSERQAWIDAINSLIERPKIVEPSIDEGLEIRKNYIEGTN